MEMSEVTLMSPTNNVEGITSNKTQSTKHLFQIFSGQLKQQKKTHIKTMYASNQKDIRSF